MNFLNESPSPLCAIRLFFSRLNSVLRSQGVFRCLLILLYTTLSACSRSSPSESVLSNAVSTFFQNSPRNSFGSSSKLYENRGVHAYRVVNEYVIRVDNEDRRCFEVVAFIPDSVNPIDYNGTLRLNAFRGTFALSLRGNAWQSFGIKSPQPASDTYTPTKKEISIITSLLPKLKEIQSQISDINKEKANPRIGPQERKKHSWDGKPISDLTPTEMAEVESLLEKQQVLVREQETQYQSEIDTLVGRQRELYKSVFTGDAAKR